ncbi:hypothetical protein FC35_GL000970 [Limosilactobacillus coleohominis DSM 14060]|nr:hypothetical protein FC35_GL000970 [Limosilactobacillus coleohominis DSM 14060]
MDQQFDNSIEHNARTNGEENLPNKTLIDHDPTKNGGNNNPDNGLIGIKQLGEVYKKRYSRQLTDAH